MSRSALTLLLAASSLGCVAKGRHELVEVQLEATRTALSARRAQCIVDQTVADEQAGSLRGEIAARQAQLDELTAQMTVRDGELDGLQAERLALLDRVASLEAEIAGLREALQKQSKKPIPPRPTAGIVELGRPEVVAQIQAEFHRELDAQRHAKARDDAEAAFAAIVASGRAELLVRGEAAVVRIQTGMLFQEGFTTLSPRGQQLVADVKAALATLGPRRVTIEGHTDNEPVHTTEFPSNWDRGFSRGVAVLRGLEASDDEQPSNLVPPKLSVQTFGDTQPIAPNDTPEGRARNDRVELVIQVDPELVTAFPPTAPEEPPPEGEPEPTPAPAEPPPEN